MDIFATEFVPNEEASTGHKNWVKANKGEATKWATFRDRAIAYKKGDPQVTVPAMATKHGKALVAAGKEHMSVTDLGAVWAPPVPPPQPPGGWTGPVQITSGGSYSLTAQSTSASVPAVEILTSAPVTITGWIRNLSGGIVIQAEGSPGLQLTVRDTYVYGGPTKATSNRWLKTYQHKSILIENCTIENTYGMQIKEDQAAATITITKCRHTDIQGGIFQVDPNVGNFVQFIDIDSSTILVSWCEVINHFPNSMPTDIISIFQSNGVVMEDCYLYGQYEPTMTNVHNMNGITIDPGTTGSSNNTIRRCQVVDGAAIGMFGGSNNLFQDNRIVHDGKMPDGVTNIPTFFFEGLFITTGGTGNHAHGNIVGYVGGQGRHDGRLDGAVEGNGDGQTTGEWANNTHMPDPLPAGAKAAETTFWNNKLATNGITIGVDG